MAPVACDGDFAFRGFALSFQLAISGMYGNETASASSAVINNIIKLFKMRQWPPAIKNWRFVGSIARTPWRNRGNSYRRALSLSLLRALSFSLSALGRQSGSGVWWFLARKRCSISRASGVVQGGRRTSLARRASVGLSRPGRAMIAVTMVWVCVARRLEAHYA